MSRPIRRTYCLLLTMLLLPAGVAAPQAAGQAGAPSAAPGLNRAQAPRPERPAASRPAGETPAARQLSISEAVRWVQRSTGGQILGAEQVPFEGRSITRVKYMDHRGRVRYMDNPGPGGERRARGGPRRDDNDDP
ncbi:hypothetical protein [Pseudoxanthomonas taiwanensis]|jgi:hypothetical protein|uniref:hypothetical protein n=1 Tax=Pseudoxanthomonas taiwanensis TaxID=176598 RepID=UPI0031B58BD7